MTSKREEITRRLPWATAAVAIIVVAIVAAWALWPTAPSGVLPTAITPGGTGAITTGEGPSPQVGGVFAMTAQGGLNAIYIMDTDNTAWSLTENLWTYGTSVDGPCFDRITTSGGTATIPYERNFTIVVEVMTRTPYIAYPVKENLRVWLITSGQITISGEYSTDDNEGHFSGSGTDNWWNVTSENWDYLVLPAGTTMDIDNCSLETWY